MSGGAAAERSSPWVVGPSVQAFDQRPLSGPGTTLNPMAAYNLYFQDGGTVHRLEAGAQIRKYNGVAGNALGGMYFGGEAAVGWLHDRYEGGTSSHFGGSFGPIVGLPLRQGPKPVHLTGLVGLSHYGSTGYNVRVGVEFKR